MNTLPRPNWQELERPIPVSNPEFKGHPYRFNPVTHRVEVWQEHAREWRTAVALTTDSIAAMARATSELAEAVEGVDRGLEISAEAGNGPEWNPHTRIMGDGGTHTQQFPFGPTLWDGSRARIEVRQHFGAGVTPGVHDRFNPWKSGRPLAWGVMLANLDADGCRDAAAALIEAAELLEKLEAGVA